MLGRLATVAVALAVHPAAAVACPACYASLGSHLLHMYYLSTIFLSLLPFAVVIALVAVGRNLRRRFRELPGQERWSAGQP